MSELPHIGPPETKAPATAPELPTAPSNDDQPHTAKPFAPLVGFLDIGESEMTNKTQTVLQEIWDYLAEETNSELISEKLHALSALENRLSPPKIGQSRLIKIHQYIQAQKAVSQAEKWRDVHLRRNNASA